jgi:hypothetical protein
LQYQHSINLKCMKKIRNFIFVNGVNPVVPLNIAIYIRFEVFTVVTMRNYVFLYIKKPSLYFTGDILRLRYRAQTVNAIYDLRFSRR